MSNGRQQLDGLEGDELYVFHGSGLLLEELEPRQAYTFANGKQEKESEPALFASASAVYAISLRDIELLEKDFG